MHGADKRMDADEAVRRTGRRADGAKRARIVGQIGGRGPRGADRRTGGRGADGRTGRWAIGQTSRLGDRGLQNVDGGSGGQADWTVGGRRGAVRRTGWTGGQADEGVGLGLKGAIPPTPFHSWAPSPLASSKCECAGCLGL